MSIDITIRQKGFFKKDLPLEIILGNNLSYGAYDDGWRLEIGVMDGANLRSVCKSGGIKMNRKERFE